MAKKDTGVNLEVWVDNQQETIASVRALAQRISDLTAGLADGIGKVCDPEHSDHPMISEKILFDRDQPLIASIAKQELSIRRRRSETFGAEMFGEPAWDMLLDLVIQRTEKRRVTVTSACVASCAPLTTALRWISVLEAEGLVTRVKCDTDRRASFIELSDTGWMKMARHLMESISR